MTPPPADQEPVRILLIEDDLNDAALIERELRRGLIPFVLRRADSEASVRAALRDFTPTVVLTDHSLPAFNAGDALRLVQEWNADTPVIVVTGSLNEETAVDYIKTGAVDYIVKQRLERLPSAVQHAIDVRRARAEQQRAEGELRRSEARHKAILDSALDAHITIDKSGAITSWNPQATAVFGWPAAEVLGQRLADVIIPPTLRDGHRRGIERFLATAEGPILNRRRELTALHRDGREFPIELAVTPIHIGDDWFFSGFVRDITERKSGEEALLERTRVAELGAGIGVALTSGRTLPEILKDCCEGLVRHLDAAFARIWTLNAPLQMLELQASAGLYTHLDGPHSRVAVGQYKIGLIASERLPHLTNTVIGDPRVSDQEWAKREGMVAFAGYPLLVEGQVVGVVAMFARHPFTAFVRDALGTVAGSIAVAIEGRRAEDALRESERRARTLFETVNLIVLGLDAAGTVDYVNPFFLRLSGYTRDEVLGRPWVTGFLPEAEQAVMRRTFLDLLEHDAHPHYENALLTKAGEERMIAWTNTVLRDAQGRRAGTLSIGEDITERARLENQLRQAQKMEAVGRLAGGVAHDFNNVLTAIFGYVDLLADEFPEGTPPRADIDEIRKAAHRAAGLTRQLLAFSRRQMLQPVVLRLNDLVEEIDKMLRRLIGEDVELNLALAADLGNVRADPSQLQQVVVNLVVNARDAMPTGGKLTIETANADLSAEYAEGHQPVAPGPYVLLAVSDTGIGMDAQVRGRLFEPFFTTKEKGKGTGLGLATVYGIVKQSGGFVWAYSEPGRGATFKVYLPRVDAPIEAPALAREPHGALAGTETVLLAEDDELIRPLARGLLRKLGYTVLDAGNADEALNLARAHGGPIHLLVTDVVMPGESGRALAQQLSEVRPAMRVLYVSGYTDDTIVRHGMLEPGLHFLQKPFTPSALAHKVREVLDAPPASP